MALEDLGTVRYGVADGVATVAMNRPERHNALDHALLDDLMRAFDRAEDDAAVRVIVLRGEGRSFCSGWDTGGSPYTTPPEGGRWSLPTVTRALRDIEARYQRIWNCVKPTIARVHGTAIAGGCYLQLLCDISIAASSARLGHPAVKMGGATSMPLWQVVLGVRAARYLLLTGRIVDAAEAERIGLVTRAVPDAELDATVAGIAADIAAIPAAGLQHSKETLNTALDIAGLGAMFRYHGQMNALGRLRRPDD